MQEVTPHSSRKADHIRINLDQDVRSRLSTGLENYQFNHNALPDLNLSDVDTSTTLYNRILKTPLLISSMTGGTEAAIKINSRLAEAAAETRIAMAVGSQRAAIDRPELTRSFQIRKLAPDILLFANLGAIQLNYGYGVTECQQAVEMIAADALILHLNPLQEAVQPEGQTNFHGLLCKIEAVCRALEVPVIVKEVGWGISESVARSLANAGVDAIDVAGAGGTSWSQVEMHRSEDKSSADIARAFIDWGIPTSDTILQVKRAAPTLKIFASGGLQSGIDIAKCIALGATLGGMASSFLKTATESAQKTVHLIEVIQHQLQICMFAVGIQDLVSLAHAPLQRARSE